MLKDKLVLLETLALKEPLDPQGCKELLDQLDLQVKLSLLVIPALLECKALRDQRVLLV